MRYSSLVLFSSTICVASLVFSGCSGSLMSSGSNPVSTAGSGPVPVVIAVGEQVNGVAPNRKQEVQFSEAMDPATINARSFQVTDSSGKPASGTVSYDPDFETASFLPNPPLQTNTSYTATITTAVSSTGGMHMASAYTYAFTTRADTDTSPLLVNSVDPAANATCVSATAPLVITFDEAPDAATVIPGNFVVTGPGGAIAVKISMNVTTTQVVLTPTTPLPSGTITVAVSNVADLAGVNMAAPYTWSFSTACSSGGGGGSGAEYFYFAAGLTTGNPEFYAYAIDAATGNLTPVPGMPFQASIGVTPLPCAGSCRMQALADPMGRFLFYNFLTSNHQGVGSMKVDAATGALTNDDVLDDGFNGTSNPAIDNISADPQGRFIYGAGTLNTPPNGTDWISSIAVSSDGKLSFAPGEPFQYPEGNNGGNMPAPAATYKFLFVADTNLISLMSNQPSKMFTFELNQTTGAMGAVHNILDGLSANMQVITPSGKLLYSERHSIMSNGLQGPAELAGFQVNIDGSLTPISQTPIPTPQQPTIITMSPNGNFLYVSGTIFSGPSGGPFTSTNDIRAYAIDQNTGSLSLTADYTNNAQGIVPTIDPAVNYVYIPAAVPSNPGAFGLAVYRVDPVTGALTAVPGPLITFPGVNLGSGAIVRPQ